MKRNPLEIIANAKRRKTADLDLSDLGLSSLPDEVGTLFHLQSLRLAGNHLKSLPPLLGCKKLRAIHLDGNKLSEFPQDLVQLPNLRTLVLAGNRLKSLPVTVGDFPQLETLSLAQTRISSIPPELGKLKKLRVLNLSDNQLKLLPPEIGDLAALRELDLSSNRLMSLPPTIGRLGMLKDLVLCNNRLNFLPLEIGQLRSLEDLSLSGNPLAALPPELGGLAQLRSLYLVQTSLQQLPVEMVRLEKLERLVLNEEQLRLIISREGNQHLVERLMYIGSGGTESGAAKGVNTFEYIPPEILDQKPREILHYILQHQNREEKKQPVNEAKVIFVGQAGVGKTSLVKRLRHQAFDPKEKMTEGIEINQWFVQAEDKRIRLNTWDFGGQEIMYATHQFFLTKRAVYVLVLDSRQSEQDGRVEYWLKIIQVFGEDSPVIVVCNKSDQHQMELDWRGLQERWPNIKGFIRNASCETKAGIEEARRAIISAVAGLEHVHYELLASWAQVKDHLEQMEEDYLSYADYEQICLHAGVRDDDSQRVLIRFLHDLGIVLNFQGDPRLEDTNILNPEWATKGVYQILNSNELFQAKGVLKLESLRHILDASKYPRDKHLFIINMMRKFELCFDFEGAADQFLVPDLLPKEETYTGDWDDSLRFEYHYDVLINSIISRFIVRMHAHIPPGNCWRTGALVRSEEGRARALVRAYPSEMRIVVAVSGKAAARQALKETIRAEFKSIHATLPRVQVREKIALPSHPDVLVRYDHILRLSQSGVDTFIPEDLPDSLRTGSPIVVNVAELLDYFQVGTMTKPTSRKEERPPERAPLDHTLDLMAQRYATHALWLIVLAIVLTLGAVGVAIWLWSWNKVEPWTYGFGVVSLLASSVYFAKSRRELSWKGIYNHILEARKETLYKEFGVPWNGRSHVRRARP